MIRFQCSCGKRLKIEDAHAGQMVECTACGKRLLAPEAPAGRGGPEAATGTSRRFQQPGVPVADVVEGPASEPDDPLKALARAANGNGGAKAKRAVARPGVAARPGAALVRPPARKASATAQILGKRRPAAPSHAKTIAVVVGVTGLVLVIALVVLVVSSMIGNPPPDEQPKPAQVTEPPNWSKHPPGEMFPNKPFEPRPDEAASPPAKPGK